MSTPPRRQPALRTLRRHPPLVLSSWPALLTRLLGRPLAAKDAALRPPSHGKISHPPVDRSPAARPATRRPGGAQRLRPLSRHGDAAAPHLGPAGQAAASRRPAVAARSPPRGAPRQRPLPRRPGATASLPCGRARSPEGGPASVATVVRRAGARPTSSTSSKGAARPCLGAPHPVLQPVGRPCVLQGLARCRLGRRRRAPAQLDAGPRRPPAVPGQGQRRATASASSPTV